MKDAIIEHSDSSEDPIKVVTSAIQQTKITTLSPRPSGIPENTPAKSFGKESSTPKRVSRGCISPDSSNTIISGDTADTDGCETPIIHSGEK